VTRDHGKFINLQWDDDPTVYYVRGHVTAEEFAAAIEPWMGTEVASDLAIRDLEHTYARWIPTPHGDFDYVIRETTKGRGCFPVTAVRP
jgi:hypothetical protein